MSRLWDQPKLTFISDVEHAGKMSKTLDMDIDFQYRTAFSDS